MQNLSEMLLLGTEIRNCYVGIGAEASWVILTQTDCGSNDSDAAEKSILHLSEKNIKYQLWAPFWIYLDVL